MVTGIETAGLVLAAFPILMEVLSSAHTVKEIWRYRVTLRMLRRAIRVEKCKFEEIWYYLLQLAGEDPNAVGDPPWSDEFQKKLLAHLRESSRVSFVDACEDLNTILGELNEKLGQNENNDIARYKRILKAVSVRLSAEYCNTRIQQIRILNEDLERLVNGLRRTRITTVQQVNSKVNVAGHYERVRRHAMVLYGALKEQLQTPCACPPEMPAHRANLQLEMRVTKENLKGCRGLPASEPRPLFDFIFPVVSKADPRSQNWVWRHLQLEHLEGVAVTPPDTGSSQAPPGALPHIAFTQIPIHQTQNVADSGTVVSTYHSIHPTLPACVSGPSTSEANKQKLGSDNVTIPIFSISRASAPASTMMNAIRSAFPSSRRNAQARRSQSSRSPSPMPGSSAGCLPRPEHRAPARVSFDLPSDTGNLQASVCNSTVDKPCLSECIIECFCSTLQEATDADGYLGMIISKENLQHRVWVPKQPLSLLVSLKTVSLADMLALRAPQGIPPRSERLKLGVKLASSVMQLHQTEWLGERWSKHDIFFIQEEPQQPTRVMPSLEIPVVHRAFTSDTPMPQAPPESRIVRCNSLFCLGITLIELWYWQNLESLHAVHSPQKNVDTLAVDITAEYCIAVTMLEKLYGDAGEDYGNIVRCCIAEFGPRDTPLEEAKFKNEVYVKVMQPLEEYIKNFCRESDLVNIFGNLRC